MWLHYVLHDKKLFHLHVIGSGSALRGAVIAFYLSNEGLSVLENAAYIGLPIPDKLKAVSGAAA